ncbi:hypothetical protein LIER_05403 [Lithospermum erythrorhizon]|uniref:Uncharacterized protein n=1 Tax=Lithospermum erythrorhizon TaxID=34254 RepID=A0AAV3P4H2_LITER
MGCAFYGPSPVGEKFVVDPSRAVQESRGVRDGTSQSLREFLSTSPVPPSEQGLGTLPPTDSTPPATPILADDHSVTVVLELEDHWEVVSATPHTAPTSSPSILVPQVARLSPSPPEALPSSRRRVGSPPANLQPAQSRRRSDKAPLSQVRILS